MKTNNYVVDTHSLVWYFTESPRLSKKALKVFEKTLEEGAIIIPTVRGKGQGQARFPLLRGILSSRSLVVMVSHFYLLF